MGERLGARIFAQAPVLPFGRLNTARWQWGGPPETLTSPPGRRGRAFRAAPGNCGRGERGLSRRDGDRAPHVLAGGDLPNGTWSEHFETYCPARWPLRLDFSACGTPTSASPWE